MKITSAKLIVLFVLMYIFIFRTITGLAFDNEGANASLPSDIAHVYSENYISAYDLRTALFFDQEIWSVLNEDARAFILEQTIINTARSYGVFPRIYIEACNLQDKQATWKRDEQRIEIDREFLSTAPVEEALFLCHQMFYRAYVEYLISLKNADELPPQYAGCIEQIEEYKSNLNSITVNSEEDGMYCLLDHDATFFALSNVEYYYSFSLPRENEPLYETQLRRLWKDMLNQYFKCDLLQVLANDISIYYEIGLTYELMIEDSLNVDYNNINIYDKTSDKMMLIIDEDLLSYGDPFECLRTIMSEIAVYALEDQHDMVSDNEMNEWINDATAVAWDRLKSLLKERIS